MRDQMKMGQEAFFYHSNCKEPGIAAIVKVRENSKLLWHFVIRFFEKSAFLKLINLATCSCLGRTLEKNLLSYLIK